MITTPTSGAADLPEALRLPLDSLHADAGYLCSRLLNGSLTQEQVVESIHRRLDAAKLAALTAQAISAEPAGAEYAPLTGRTHELKTDAAVFAETLAGRKLFEIRKNDRDYQCGDILRLRATRLTGAEMEAGQPLIYTGQEELRRVVSIVRGPRYGLAEGWVIMSVVPVSERASHGQAPDQPEVAVALNGQLYAALGNLFSHLGAEGCVGSDHPFVWDAMTALKRIDGGVYLDDLAVPVDPDAHRDDLLNAVQLLEDGEWSEHFAKTPLGMRLEDQITKLHGEAGTPTPQAADTGAAPYSGMDPLETRAAQAAADRQQTPIPSDEEILTAARNWGDVTQYHRGDGKGSEHRIVFTIHQRAAYFARELFAPLPARAPADSVLEDAARLDNCTDPNNCKRCKSHPNHRAGLEHAGIPTRKQGGQKP